MEKQKTYLTFWQKVAYGSGDFGSNFFYMLLTSFAMLYLGNYVGLDVGIVGTLMAVSKLLDGITDVFFGRLIDKTNTRMGKARPWMFFSAFPLALSLIFCFAIPASLPEVGKYAFFFVFYTAANALFYTANNISYAAMTAYITRNDSERVSLGTYRYIFAVVASVLVMSITAVLVEQMGGDLAAWRNVAILFAVVLLIFNSLASLSCKELPPVEEEPAAPQATETQPEKKENFFTALKIILTNKYYLLLLAIYLLVINFTAFALMGLDKRRARQGRWRISEKALFLFPLLGGALGGLLGMRFFHHKTRHWYFRFGLPLLLLAQAGLGGWLVLGVL